MNESSLTKGIRQPAAPRAGTVIIAAFLIWMTVLPALEVANASEVRPQMLFNRGNYLMEQQEYSRALEHFREIEEHGYESGPLFYNMGISYIYLDSLGKAAWYFQKSTNYRVTSDPAGEGLSFIEQTNRSRGFHIPQLTWYAFIDWMLFEMNHFSWIVMGLLLLNAGVLLLLAGWIFYPDRRLVFGGGAAGSAGLILLLLSITIYIVAQGYRQAVVMETRTPLQPEPTALTLAGSEPEAYDGDLAYEAFTVTLDVRKSRQHDDWVHVRLRNGARGWVPDTAVCEL